MWEGCRVASYTHNYTEQDHQQKIKKITQIKKINMWEGYRAASYTYNYTEQDHQQKIRKIFKKDKKVKCLRRLPRGKLHLQLHWAPPSTKDNEDNSVCFKDTKNHLILGTPWWSIQDFIISKTVSWGAVFQPNSKSGSLENWKENNWCILMTKARY